MSSRAAELRSIGEVITTLRDEFPELSVSKIRFLEGQGLVEPQRSASGYRLFSSEDVQRIAFILREQRDNYLPLKVIKSRLAAWDRGDEPTDVTSSGPPPESYFASSGISMSAEELAKAAGLAPRHITELVDHGLLLPIELPDGSHVYQDDDLVIARAARRLIRQGLEGRHLRAIRLAADREVELLQQLVAPMLRHRNPDNRRRAAEILADTAHAGALLGESIVRTRIRKLLER
ncbi:MAG: MerR family transcriptional regulator [bacterium]|nr:MerR family transcriptional regulator [bacterium]